jgi:ligand-binding sensor domain-containing protein/signal transduction histidine kinase
MQVQLFRRFSCGSVDGVCLRCCRPLLLLAFFFIGVPSDVLGQAYTSSIYTVEHGLPGNNLNCLLQDKRGFIWIGSENGLVRFDGNSFRQYRTTDGLADNEITSLRMDADGRIWALPYRKAPSVYNQLRDRFESSEGLNRLSLEGDRSLDVLEGGGVALNTADGAHILRESSIEAIGPVQNYKNTQTAHIIVSLGNEKYLLIAPDSFRIFDHGRYAGSQPSFMPQGARMAYVNHALYYCDSNGICKTALSSAGGVRQLCMAHRSINASRLSFTGKHLALISDNGTTASLIDTGTLAEVASLPLNGALARDVMEDAAGNIWIATIGQGLIKLSQHPIVSYNSFLPTDMAPGTVAIDGPILLAGDNKGRIAVFRHGCIERIINISQWSKAISRIRSIVVLKDGYYIAVEGDASMLLDKQYNFISLFNRPLLNYSDRCAVLWQDSIVLAGSHNGAVRLAYKACRAYDPVPIRTTAIGADKNGRMIIGSSDGAYRKDDTGLYYFGRGNAKLANRVNDICVTRDGLVWVAMAANYLVAITGDRIAGVIPFSKEIPGNVCNTLSAGKPGQLWIGTDLSLSRIEYTYDNGRLKWEASSFGASEGITGQVADIAWQQDSVYVATSNGVFSLPVSLQPDVRDIPVIITGISINDKDTVLNTNWDLPYSQNNWDIRFAAIDLSGYAPAYQYRINGEAWQDITEGHLQLTRLSPGSYNIQIRALKRDGTPSSEAASMKIHLRSPFWMSVWFWLAMFILLLGLSAAVLQHFFRRKREKQLRSLSIENELVTSQQQTFSALMNPHFIFNALNSIQHYVLAQDKKAANRYLSGFGRLIRMNFESAQKSYISLEEELERLQLYLSLEKMRFGDKLSYSIEVAEDVVPEDWQIPAMIIQPYLENSLLHGIAPAKIAGKLDIRVWCKDHDLFISICDNGIGIEASKRLKGDTAHASHSMELIAKRIAVLRKLRKQDIDISLAANSEGDAAHPGTCVLMSFPEHHAG